MLTYYVEYEDLKANLERVEIPAVREIVDPIRQHLDRRLSDLGVDDDLDVIFALDEDGNLSVSFRGTPLSVNVARDILGERERVGKIVS